LCGPQNQFLLLTLDFRGFYRAKRRTPSRTGAIPISRAHTARQSIHGSIDSTIVM
jgi:hypothetical protein